MCGLEVARADHAEDEVDREKHIVQVEAAHEERLGEQLDHDGNSGGIDGNIEKLGESDLEPDHSGEDESDERGSEDEDEVLHQREEEEQDEQPGQEEQHEVPYQVRDVPAIRQEITLAERNDGRGSEGEQAVVERILGDEYMGVPRLSGISRIDGEQRGSLREHEWASHYLSYIDREGAKARKLTLHVRCDVEEIRNGKQYHDHEAEKQYQEQVSERTQ